MIEMQAASDKTFHLKWNNHLQNLSQLFTTIYSSSALADVTLACRDGTLRAHKLVLSACSPYFEQIFKDNPCKHPVVILKGIPYSEINLLVEFMYKGSVDVQELDLQSLMHTASELEIRGLAYEVRTNAAQLLNVNLEYPAFSPPAVTVASTAPYDGTPRTMPRADMERLKQIHMYQQSMIREAELAKRKRREEATPANTTNAVKSILAAAAKELADGTRERTTSCVQTEDGETTTVKTEMFHAEEETWSKPKKRVSIVTPEEERRNKRKMQYVVKQSPQHEGDDGLSKLRISAVTGGDAKPETPMSSSGSIKVVNISALQQPGPPADPLSDDEDSMLLQERSHHNVSMEEEDSCSSESASESMHDNSRDSRPHVCDICDIRFQRASHLSRHRLTHTGERPFTCGGCGKSFARSDKLRVHTKICERDDPTVDMAEDGKVDSSSEVMSGTVRITHRDSRQLMFTPSGDVMLAPRAAALPTTQPTSLQSPDTVNMDTSKMEETPMKRGRGRPKKPVPDIPKVKKRRGRPPKALTELDMMMGLGNGVSPLPVLGAGVSGLGVESAGAVNTVPMQQHITPSGQQLIVKRKRGRPPKNFFQPLSGVRLPESFYEGNFAANFKTYGQPKENYNATNLPFGDFSYLTEMINYPGGIYQHAFHNVTTVDPEQDVDVDSTPNPNTAPARNRSIDSHNRTPDGTEEDGSHARRDRTIDLSSSSSDDGTEDSRADNTLEGDDNVPAAICETEIMTVGDCQILKLPPSGEEPPKPQEASASENGKLSITAITSIGDCTIRPVDADAHQ